MTATVTLKPIRVEDGLRRLSIGQAPTEQSSVPLISTISRRDQLAYIYDWPVYVEAAE